MDEVQAEVATAVRSRTASLYNAPGTARRLKSVHPLSVN
jgi:hypothetical protein